MFEKAGFGMCVPGFSPPPPSPFSLFSTFSSLLSGTDDLDLFAPGPTCAPES